MKLFEFTEQAIPILPLGFPQAADASKKKRRVEERSRSCPIGPALIASKLLVSSFAERQVRFLLGVAVLNRPRERENIFYGPHDGIFRSKATV